MLRLARAGSLLFQPGNSVRSRRIKGKNREVSASPKTEIGSFKPEFATRFIKERNPIAEDLATHPTACRSKIREAQDQGLVDKPQAKRLLSSNENLDAELLKVRAALARNRIKVEYGSLSQPTHSRIDEAYLPMLAGPVRYQDYKTGAAETA